MQTQKNVLSPMQAEVRSAGFCFVVRSCITIVIPAVNLLAFIKVIVELHIMFDNYIYYVS